MHSLFYRNKILNSHIIFNTHSILTFLFLILSLLELNSADLTVYDSSNNEITTYENTDIFGIHKPDYGVSGQLIIASFAKPNDKDDPCKIINLPLIDEDTILVVPFHDAYNVGCMSYSDIIESNNWENNDDVDIPSSKVPDDSVSGEQDSETQFPTTANTENNNDSVNINNNNDNNDAKNNEIPQEVPKEAVNAPKTPNDPIDAPADKNPPDTAPPDKNPKDTTPDNTPKDITTDNTPK
ncbi:8842_t:CDS:2, partial [Funneliformis caledonium]